MVDEPQDEGLEEEVTEAEETDDASEDQASEEVAVEVVRGERPALVSAQDLDRPTTNLPARVLGNIENLKVSLVGDVAGFPTLAEVQRLNQSDQSEARTPLMTVILAILADHGSEMSLSELSDKATEHWRRNFPGSPYSRHEFIYMLLTNSDNVLIRD